MGPPKGITWIEEQNFGKAVQPYWWFHFLWFQVPAVKHHLEADGPLSDVSLKVNSSLTLGHNPYVIHLISCHREGILSS